MLRSEQSLRNPPPALHSCLLLVIHHDISVQSLPLGGTEYVMNLHRETESTPAGPVSAHPDVRPCCLLYRMIPLPALSSTLGFTETCFHATHASLKLTT